MPDVIDTAPRLILRRWSREDADDLYDMASDPSLGEDAGWRPHRAPEDSLEAIDGVLSKDGVYAIVSRANGRPVGCIELDRDPKILRKGPKDAEVGFWIGSRYRNQGFAREALETVIAAAEDNRVSRIWARCYEGNEASAHVLSACGFRFDHRSLSENDYTGEVAVCVFLRKRNGR